MIIRNPNALPTVSIREVGRLQDKLKDITEINALKLKKSIDKHGFFIPIFIWQTPDGERVLLDGHTRKFVIEEYNLDDNGKIEVPYVLVEADTLVDAKTKLLVVSSQYGKITYEGYDEFVADLPELELLGEVSFDALPLLGQTTEDDAEQDEPPQVEEGEAISKPGSIYHLGSHRVMCGDATSEDHVSKLMGGGVMSDLYLSDPPYNVAYNDDSAANLKARRRRQDTLTIKNDKFDTWQEFRSFLTDAYRRADEHMKTGASFYIFHADAEGLNFRQAVLDVEWLLKQVLVWNKSHMVMGRQDYHWKHEPILYGWKSGKAHSWYSDRTQTTVLNFDRPGASPEHPTMKPINILVYLINNSTKSGDLVFDNFLGSGSTLIACEQTERTCYGMELDPHYVDVIRKRYAKFVYPERWEQEWEELTPEA